MERRFIQFCLPLFLLVTGLMGGQPALADGKNYEVSLSRDIVYHDVANDPERSRHMLDVYRPKGKDDAPVLIFVHGGTWMSMCKDDAFGLYGYGTIARCFARRGFVVVVPNYRLSPCVKHPEHIKDVARAFAWSCRNAGKYGGDERRIFVGGHSAGGHLVALLATDETYLKAEGRARKDIRGVVVVSGVLRVDDLDLKLACDLPAGLGRFECNVSPLALVFGDLKMRKDASPLSHVGPGLPPFLVLTGGCDYPPLTRMAREFTAALKKHDCPFEEKVIPWRTHETLLFDIARLSADRATTDAIVEFINRHATSKTH
jgi:acetyl esterase/lipase